MCQSRADGGRRCAAHHPGTLAVKYMSRNYPEVRYPLEQGQVDHIFKALKHEGRNHDAPTQEEYRAFLQEQIEMVRGNSDDPTARRIINKIERAIEFEQIPDGGSFYALKNMAARARSARGAILREVRQQADLTGSTQAQVRRRLNRMYNSLVAERGTADYTQVLDAKTRKAFEHLRNNVELNFERVRRIERTPTPVLSLLIYSSGYDPEDGRMEVEMNNGDVYAFHSVSEEDYQQFLVTPVATFSRIETSHEHDYASSTEADKDAYRLWCSSCESFRVASGHQCQAHEGRVTGRAISHDVDEIYGRVVRSVTPDQEPGTVPTVPSWRTDNDRITSELSARHYSYTPGTQGRTPSNARRINPDVSEIASRINNGEIVNFEVGRRIFVQGSGRHEHNDVTSTVTAQRVRGNRLVELSHDENSVRCTCEVYQNNGRCTHTHPNGRSVNRFVRQDIRDAIQGITGNHEGQEFITANDIDYRNRAHLVPEGEELEDGYRELSQDQINGALYELSLSPQTTVRIDLPDENGESNAWVSVSATQDVRFDNYPGEVPVDQFTAVRTRLEEQLGSAVRNTEFMRDRLRNAAERSVTNGWEINSQSREEYLNRFSAHASNGYLVNPDQFISDYREAQNRSTAGESTFVAQSVTGGNLSNVQGQGRGFGIEIEVNGNYTAINDITDRLQSEGLSNFSGMAYYHQLNDFSYWRMEEDGSVSGEIVSPILYDTPESWEQVRRVCEIVRENGGTINTHTGNHVHIGAQGITNAQRRGIFAAVVANQDVIRRIATDPGRRSHRNNAGGNFYTSPFNDQDIQNLYQMRQDQQYSYSVGQGRSRMANFTNENTIEFRDPDGSLDPAHIQANVMMAAALTAAGEHGRWGDLNSERTHAQRVGVNAMRQPYINSVIENEDERILAENISLMTTLDALFPEREQRQRILGVAVRNPWQDEVAPPRHW